MSAGDSPSRQKRLRRQACQHWSGSTRRLDELDSLRGLAALSVVLFHFKASWLENAAPDWSPAYKRVVDNLLLPVTAGHEAVILFFVLSGFVLSIPAIESRAQSYPVFVVRRIFRIYFPYVAALVPALAASMFFYNHAAQGGCIGVSCLSAVDRRSIAQHLILVGQFDADMYDPPIWSLVYEMRISLVFPALCALALRLRPGRSLLLAAGISGVSMMTRNLIPPKTGDLFVIDTLHYAALFAAGIYMARERGRIAEIFNCLSRRRKTGIAVVSALLYIFGRTLWQHIAYKLHISVLDNFGDWLTALGAAGIIVFSLNSEWCRRILLWAPVRALGKMSYSVYLLHFIVMAMFIHLLYGKVPSLAIYALCLVVAIAASWAFYRLVERPCMNLGRKLSGYL